MGFRTVVVLNNDLARDWEKDPLLGQKIARAMNHATGCAPDDKARLDGYGRVVSCAHTDTQMLGVIADFNFQTMAVTTWKPGQTADERALQLLKDAAAKLGYRLVKQPK